MAESMSYAPEAQKNELLKQSIDPKSMDKLMSGINKANEQKEITQQFAKKDQIKSTEELNNKLSMLYGGAIEEGKPNNTEVQTPNTILGVDGKNIAKPITTPPTEQMQKVINSGKPNPDQTNKALNNMDKLISGLPEGLKKFFTGILDFIKGMSGIDSKTDLSKSLKNPEDQKTLDKYAKTEIGSDGKVNMKFDEGAKISKSTQEKTPDGKTPDGKTEKIEPKISKIDGTNLVLEKDSKVTNIKDSDGTLTLVVQNKNGSTDTYTVANIKEKPKTPSSTPETKPV